MRNPFNPENLVDEGNTLKNERFNECCSRLVWYQFISCSMLIHLIEFNLHLLTIQCTDYFKAPICKAISLTEYLFTLYLSSDTNIKSKYLQEELKGKLNLVK